MFAMEDLSSFLELPLDKELYFEKPKNQVQKPPLKILITEANSKIAQKLIYKIATGEVFGPDQEVLFHFIYSKAKKDPAGYVSEFYSCGFSTFIDAIVTSDPKQAYKDVDLVISINLFEELQGYPRVTSYLYQSSTAIKVAKNVIRYGKKDTKLVICSPSTKGSVTLLSLMRQLDVQVNEENVSAVTVLDEIIAKAVIAAKVGTITNDVKNVVIWGATHADVYNCTVFMYLPDDLGRFKKVDVPLIDALNDDFWIRKDLYRAIYARISYSYMVSQGAALAAATALHLKHLYQGSEQRGEMFSMGVLVPKINAYGLTPMVGFSFPVKTENGKFTIVKEVTQENWSIIQNFKEEFNLSKGRLQVLLEAIDYFVKHKLESRGELDRVEMIFDEKVRTQNVKLRFILTAHPKYDYQTYRRNSIGWKETEDSKTHVSSRTKSIGLKFMDTR